MAAPDLQVGDRVEVVQAFIAEDFAVPSGHRGTVINLYNGDARIVLDDGPRLPALAPRHWPNLRVVLPAATSALASSAASRLVAATIQRPAVEVFRPPAHAHRAAATRSAAHLDRGSVRLEGRGSDVLLAFTADASEPCEVKVWLGASTSSLRESACAQLPAGHRRAVECYLGESCIGEVVVRIELAAARARELTAGGWQGEWTRLEVRDLVIRSTRQDVLVIGKAREMLDVYGLDAQDGLSGDQCIICVSALCNVLVLPCRHCCICSDCATRMRASESRCPMCRQLATHLLQVDAADRPGSCGLAPDTTAL